MKFQSISISKFIFQFQVAKPLNKFAGFSAVHKYIHTTIRRRRTQIILLLFLFFQPVHSGILDTDREREMGRSRTQQRALKVGMILMGLCLAGYIVGRPLYYHLSEALTAARRHVPSSSYHRCPPCLCDCPSQSLLSLPDGNFFYFLFYFFFFFLNYN